MLKSAAKSFCVYKRSLRTKKDNVFIPVFGYPVFCIKRGMPALRGTYKNGRASGEFFKILLALVPYVAAVLNSKLLKGVIHPLYHWNKGNLSAGV